MTNKENGLPTTEPLWEVPIHWKWCSILDVGNIITGNTPSTKVEANYGTDIPFVKPPELMDRSIRSASSGLSEKGMKTARILPAGSVLVSCIGGLGKTGITKVPVAFNQQINAIIFNKNILPEYGFYYTQTLKPWLSGVSSATTLPIVNKGKFQRAPFPLAPLNEQKRIVAEIEKQFSRLDEAVANLKRVKANLKRYKAAVLKAAVEGKLTKEWRKQHPDVESASKLLEQILTEHRKTWEQAELVRMKGRGKMPKNDKWKKKYTKSAVPDFEDLPTIPNTWTWATPTQLASYVDYSLAIGPFGSNLKVSDYRDEGVPLIFVRNIRTGIFEGKNTKYVSISKAKELKAHEVNGGDILITKMGDPPGDACLYSVDLPRAIITADCIKWTLSSHLPCAEFFVNTINSQVLKAQILQITKGVAQLKVSLTRFKGIAVPLPPQKEQSEILNEVESRLSIIGGVVKIVDSNLNRAEYLRKSILKKAFSGQLIN